MSITSYPRTARLVNRFSLGADPEFVFTTKAGGYIYAEGLGMNTLQAFGCDMAGRQAELRAHPSKFALRVVASMVDALRWMAFTYPACLTYDWTAVAYNGQDGIGGHVHFGRRRPDLEHDKVILDTTAMTLIGLGVYNETYFKKRQTKTRAYGGYGDIRRQAHGYEYRTLPTQMASPWMSYFNLVINKLVLYQGSAWKPLPKDAGAEVTALLEKYADVDDDAAIALKALKRFGLPQDVVLDFKPFWGIDTNPYTCAKVGENGRTFFPSTIEPEEQTCIELFDYLVNGVALPKRTPKPTWQPFTLPQGFNKVTVMSHTLGHAPDIAMNLVSNRFDVHVVVDGNPFPYIQYNSAIPLSHRDIRKAVKDIEPVFKFYPNTTQEGIELHIPSGCNKSLTSCKFFHRILADTRLFPVCKAEDLMNVDWSRWNPVHKKEKPLMGKLIAKVIGSTPSKTEKKTVSESLKKDVAGLQYVILDPNKWAPRVPRLIPVRPRPARPRNDPEFLEEEEF